MSDEKVEFAFLVVKQPDGRIAIGNLEGYEAQRQPTIDDIYSSLSIVQRDLQTQQTVGAVVGLIQQMSGQNQSSGGVILPEPTNKFKKVARAK